MTTETRPADDQLIAECQAEEDAANSIRLPCGSCDAPQPLGTATCSECKLDPRWIVEPCDFCHGAPLLVSAPAGESDFSGGGCRKCEGGWVPTVCAEDRAAKWKVIRLFSPDYGTPEALGSELVENPDPALPYPADEYARRESLLRARLRFRQVLVLSCGSCGFPQDSGTTQCSECGLNPRLVVEPCENCKGGARTIPGGCTQCDGLGNDETMECGGRFGDRRTLISQGYKVPDEEIAQRLTDPAAEYVRRYGRGSHDGADRKLILFEDEDTMITGDLAADLDRQEVEEREDRESRASVERQIRTAELLGEAIEMLQENSPTPGEQTWIEQARPFALFKPAPSDAPESRDEPESEADQDRRRLEEGRALIARLAEETRAVEDRTRARADARAIIAAEGRDGGLL